MRQEESPCSPLVGPDSFSEAERADLRRRHFTELEAESIAMMRLRYQQGLDSSDIPADERRLLFARWLVEHGRLTENAGCDSHDMKCRRENLPTQRPDEDIALRLMDKQNDLMSLAQDTGKGSASSRGQQHVAPGDAVRRGLGWLAKALRNVATWIFVPEEPWDAGYGPGGQYPHMSPWSYLDDPLFWRHFRSGW